MILNSVEDVVEFLVYAFQSKTHFISHRECRIIQVNAVPDAFKQRVRLGDRFQHGIEAHHGYIGHTMKSSTNYHCPVLQTPLKLTCENKPCKYWIDFSPSDNCLLAHATAHDTDHFNFTEISYLLGVHIGSVIKAYSNSLKLLRKEIVSDAFEDSELEKDFVVRPSLFICANCECYVEQAFHQTRIQAWCSAECLAEKSVAEFCLELKFGITVDKILKWAFNVFEKDDKICEALLLKHQTLETLKAKYQPVRPKTILEQEVASLQKLTEVPNTDKYSSFIEDPKLRKKLIMEAGPSDFDRNDTKVLVSNLRNLFC